MASQEGIPIGTVPVQANGASQGQYQYGPGTFVVNGVVYRRLPWYHRIEFKLITLAITVGLLLAYWLFVPTNHDPMWWIHAGIPKDRPSLRSRRQSTAIESGGSPKKMSDELPIKTHAKLNPKNGSEYLADYDVSKVVMDPEPPLTKEHPKYLFHYVDPKKSTHPFLYVSNKPRVGWIPNFLTHEECDALIAEASKTMARSQVVPYKGGGDHDAVSEVRTSTQTWLRTDVAPALDIIKRIYEFTGFPDGSGEMLQILRYEKGEKYNAHMDYFDPKLYGPQSSNRALTVFLYLSSVEDGGHTQFPRADGKPPTYDFTSCQAGLRVRPVKGTVAFFYDMKPNGEYDEYSLHGGCKPIIGTKWGGTLWLRVPTG